MVTKKQLAALERGRAIRAANLKKQCKSANKNTKGKFDEILDSLEKNGSKSAEINVDGKKIEIFYEDDKKKKEDTKLKKIGKIIIGSATIAALAALGYYGLKKFDIINWSTLKNKLFKKGIKEQDMDGVKDGIKQDNKTITQQFENLQRENPIITPPKTNNPLPNKTPKITIPPNKPPKNSTDENGLPNADEILDNFINDDLRERRLQELENQWEKNKKSPASAVIIPETKKETSTISSLLNTVRNIINPDKIEKYDYLNKMKNYSIPKDADPSDYIPKDSNKIDYTLKRSKDNKWPNGNPKKRPANSEPQMPKPRHKKDPNAYKYKVSDNKTTDIKPFKKLPKISNTKKKEPLIKSAPKWDIKKVTELDKKYEKNRNTILNKRYDIFNDEKYPTKKIRLTDIKERVILPTYLVPMAMNKDWRPGDKSKYNEALRSFAEIITRFEKNRFDIDLDKLQYVLDFIREDMKRYDYKNQLLPSFWDINMKDPAIKNIKKRYMEHLTQNKRRDFNMFLIRFELILKDIFGLYYDAVTKNKLKVKHSLLDK